MWKIAPLYSLWVVLGLWSGSSSAAGSPNLSEFRQQVRCPDSSATDNRCEAYIAGYCGAHRNAEGCESHPGGGRSIPSADYFNNALIDDVERRAERALDDLQRTRKDAQLCCSDDTTKCELPSGSTASAARSKLNAMFTEPLKGSGESDAADRTARLAELAGQAANGIAGECRGRKEACLFQASEIKKALENKLSPCNGPCSTVANKIDGVVKLCQQFNDETALAQAKQAFAQQARASQVGNATRSNNGSSFGIKDIMPYMPLATSLLNRLSQQDQSQAQHEFPQARPPEVPQADCSNPSIVGGGCAPPPRAAQAAPASWNKPGGGGSFNDTNSGAKGSYNLANNPDNLAAKLPSDVSPADSGNAATTSGISNGGGGGIPGGGGGPGAALGGVAAAAPGAPKTSTDILHGEHSGGYSQTAAAMNTSAGGNSGWSGYGHERNNEPATDWSQFLPGHAKDPARSLAGGNAQNVQIQSKDVNIWMRISDHIKARCSQGLLRDCVP